MRISVLALACLLCATTAAASFQYPFQDPSLPFDKRAADLVSRLTLEEKGAQLGHYDTADPTKSLGRANSPAISRFNVSGYNYGTECNSGIIVGFPQNIGMGMSVLSFINRVVYS